MAYILPFSSYIENWLLHKISQINVDNSISTDDAKIADIQQLIESVVVHIRFAMMTPTELAKLLLKSIIKHHTEFFVERIAVGMSYHSGQEDQVAKVRDEMVGGALQFTPRLYTSDTYSLSMSIDKFESIEDFQTFGACFFSQSNLSECLEGKFVFLFFHKFRINCVCIYLFRPEHGVEHRFLSARNSL